MVLMMTSLKDYDCKCFGCDKGIKLLSTDGKRIYTILANVYVIILGLDVVSELGYLYGSFDGSNDVKLEGLFIGGSLVSTDGKFIGSDEGIKLGYTGGKVLGTIFGGVDGITLGIDVGTYLGSLEVSFDSSNSFKLEGLLLVA